MKKLGIFMLLISFMACQSEMKTTTNSDSTAIADSTAAIKTSDPLDFTTDSVKVYGTPPLSANGKVTDTTKALIAYPLFKDEQTNQFVLQKIMATADQGKNYKSYKEYANDFIKSYENFKTQQKDHIQTWFLDIKTKVVAQKTNYLSLLSTFVSFEGGAHPNSVYTYLNYNPVNHQEIILDSLLIPGSMPRLTAIAEQIFRKNEKLSAKASLKDNYFFENNVFKLNNNFTITDKGLKFLYNPYEIKAYVYGTTELTVPFSELKSIARPNSLLSRLN